MAIATTKTDTATRVQALTDELSALLRPVLPCGEPLIVENRIAQTKSIHVAVIWDQWSDLFPQDRSKVILNAYAKVKRLRGSIITVAMGLTSEEAMRMGFLSYSIVTTRRKSDKASLDSLAKAMATAGGIVVKVGSATQLRFATLEQAENAYRDLSQKVPGPYWAIVQEQSLPE